jgi:hypothetical protein
MYVTNNKNFVFDVCVCVCMHKCFILFYFIFCIPKVHFFVTGAHRISNFWQGSHRYNSEDRFSLPLVAIRFQDMDVMALTAVGHENVFIQGIPVCVLIQ